MGHILTNKGVKVDPEKVKSIVKMTAPTSIEEVQGLNGFVNYLAKFLQQLATVMEPIRKLTRKNTPWEWSKQQQEAFEAVKKLATESPVLRYYNPDQELQVQCDASQRGLDATLLQEGPYADCLCKSCPYRDRGKICTAGEKKCLPSSSPLKSSITTLMVDLSKCSVITNHLR